ncbi:hypothetical protein PR003_g13308 [Phytophthora rubi]|uniref:Uncharacterized protein n=1 Tax=Phytophthora rubi TaxID=129364 RepID=A0A6A4FFN7_9STRA|nr:hypothetical protein PR003_g13308 [Phytophthora rubi]
MTKFEMSDDKPAGPPAMALEHAAFPHLTSIEWQALHRLAAVSGEVVVTSTDQENSLQRADVDAHHRDDALAHVNVLITSKTVAILMSAVGVCTTVVVSDHPIAEIHTAVRIPSVAEAGSHPSPVMNL